MDSIQQQLVNAVEARLQRIRAGQVIQINGDDYVFKGDLGLRVFVNLKRQLNPATDFPCMVVSDDISQIVYDGAPLGWQYNYLNVTVDCFTSGKQADLNGRKAYADVSAAVGLDPRWDGLARRTSMAENPMDMQHDIGGQILYGTRVKFTIVYLTRKWLV
jgi:hypothetical protein